MIVRRFLCWAQGADATARARGARALTRAYLAGALDASEHVDLDTAFSMLVDDASPLVRRIFSETLAPAPQAPRHIVIALANDQSDVAAPVLSWSPVLRDAELIDCAAIGDACAQTAIATRPDLSAPVTAALAEVGGLRAVLALCDNATADVPDFSLARIVERFGEDGAVREALLGRADLPVGLRHSLVVATARHLSAFIVGRSWMAPERAERVCREARDKATVHLAADSARAAGRLGARRLASHLRQSGHLTAALILRALLSGNVSLFEAALAELSGIDDARVVAIVRRRDGVAFAALYRRAGLPADLLPAFDASLACLAEVGQSVEEGGSALQRRMVERVVTACETLNRGELDGLIALLRRFEGEAAREEAAGRLDEMRAAARAARYEPPRVPVLVGYDKPEWFAA